MRIAIDKGMRLITHLYSCTSTVTRDHGFRSLGVIESAFLRDELVVELAQLDIQARYIRVRRDGDGWFSIYELKIFR